MSRRSGSRVVFVSAILTLVVGGLGLVVSLVLNAFVLDDFDAYGEVPIPGSAHLQLPAGEVTASFHTRVTGRPSGGFPIPDLRFAVNPPAGVAEPAVTESIGTTTTVNSDTRVRIWVLQVPKADTYEITTAGDVNGYIRPRLAFGHGSSYGWLPWAFGGLLAMGAVELTAALLWSARAGRRARPLQPEELSNTGGLSAVSIPNDEGMRREQLKQLAALRDSGALTEDEFEAEKRRILES